MTAVAMIPYGGDWDAHRARMMGFVLQRLRSVQPHWLQGEVEGMSPLPWSKGVALIEARSRVPKGTDVLVVHDADCWVNSERLEAAIAECETGAAWAMPHALVTRYNRATTDQLLAGVRPKRLSHHRRHDPTEGGGIVVLRTEVWDDVGGIDPRFEGWGGEDEAFGWALRTLHGDPVQIGGTLFHLWHEHAHPGRRERHRPATLASWDLRERYRLARGSERAMRDLIGDRALP